MKLFHYLAFLPTQMLAPTLATLNRGGSVPCATIPADFYEKPPPLCNGFLYRISNGQAEFTPATLRFTPSTQIYFSSSIMPGQNEQDTHNHEKGTKAQKNAWNDEGQSRHNVT